MRQQKQLPSHPIRKCVSGSPPGLIVCCLPVRNQPSPRLRSGPDATRVQATDSSSAAGCVPQPHCYRAHGDPRKKDMPTDLRLNKQIHGLDPTILGLASPVLPARGAAHAAPPHMFAGRLSVGWLGQLQIRRLGMGEQVVRASEGGWSRNRNGNRILHTAFYSTAGTTTHTSGYGMVMEWYGLYQAHSDILAVCRFSNLFGSVFFISLVLVFVQLFFPTFFFYLLALFWVAFGLFQFA